MKLASKFLVAVLGILLLASTVVAAGVEKPKHYVTVKVGPGASVWSICERVKKDMGDERDIREIVYYTLKLNAVPQGGLIQPGQQINVSVERGGERNG